jgi:hypothetical protein
VWKTILFLGSWNNKFGKWLPSWEDPYKVFGVVTGNSYFVETLEGQALPKALNENTWKDIISACGKEVDRCLISNWEKDYIVLKMEVIE